MLFFSRTFRVNVRVEEEMVVPEKVTTVGVNISN